MPICVIKNTEPKNMSIPAAIAIGGVAGLSVRQFMPVYKPEMDSFMFNQSESIKADSVNNAKNSFIKTIKNLIAKEKNNEALNLFLKERQAINPLERKMYRNLIKNAPEKIKNEVNKYRSSMALKLKAAKNLTEFNIKAAAKQARPVVAFLLPGMAIGALSGFVYNVIGTIRES